MLIIWKLDFVALCLLAVKNKWCRSCRKVVFCTQAGFAWLYGLCIVRQVGFMAGFDMDLEGCFLRCRYCVSNVHANLNDGLSVGKVGLFSCCVEIGIK